MAEDSLARPAAGPDLPAILALLEDAGLPTEGVAEGLDGFCVLEADGRVLGVAAVEVHGHVGLLRSVAVAPSARGRGYARALCERLAARARAQGLDALYLLTLDAEDYFARLDFHRLARERAPREIRRCPEFRVLCPDSAALMCRQLT